MMLFAFVLGFSSANAATIKAIKVQGDIPINADDPFWTRYGPTFHKHTDCGFGSSNDHQSHVASSGY